MHPRQHSIVDHRIALPQKKRTTNRKGQQLLVTLVQVCRALQTPHYKPAPKQDKPSLSPEALYSSMKNHGALFQEKSDRLMAGFLTGTDKCTADPFSAGVKVPYQHCGINSITFPPIHTESDDQLVFYLNRRVVFYLKGKPA